MINLYYFKVICAIGGVETFLYELAKKYNENEIVIYYDKADKYQLQRLKKYVRCVQRIKGQKVYCDRFFANFNTDMLEDVISRENYYAFVIHANFEELKYYPEINPKINHYIAVSKFTQQKFYELTGIKAELCYNPLQLEPREKVIHLVSACRLDDKVKGGARTLKLINALDNYCEEHNVHYMWTIFTNKIVDIESKNVVIAKPRTDVRPYLQEADYVLQLSNDMETYCYTINEAWSYGVHTITTPLSVLKELPIPEEANYVLDWNLENIDDVVRHIFEDKRDPFEYLAPKDNWHRLFKKSESTYRKELENMKKAKTLIDLYIEREGKQHKKGDIVSLTDEELAKGIALNYVEQVIETKPEPEKEVKKAVRKSTKK